MTSKAPIDAVTARLRLRCLLRQARRAAGLTQAQAAEALCVSRPKLTRIENGDVRASVADVRVLLERYGAHDQLGEADRLARAARGRSWTGSYSSALTPGDVACYELEPAAARVTYVDLSLVPAGAAAVRARTEVMETYRRFPTLDPRLPIQLMPRGWPRNDARAVFVAIYDGLAEPAQEHVRAIANRYATGSPPVVLAHTIAEIGNLASQSGHGGPA